MTGLTRIGLALVCLAVALAVVAFVADGTTPGGAASALAVIGGIAGPLLVAYGLIRGSRPRA